MAGHLPLKLPAGTGGIDFGEIFRDIVVGGADPLEQRLGKGQAGAGLGLLLWIKKFGVVIVAPELLFHLQFGAGEKFAPGSEGNTAGLLKIAIGPASLQFVADRFIDVGKMAVGKEPGIIGSVGLLDGGSTDERQVGEDLYL